MNNWAMAAGDPCTRCGRPTLRFSNGLCIGCDGQREIETRFMQIVGLHKRLTRDQLKELAELQRKLKGSGLK